MIKLRDRQTKKNVDFKTTPKRQRYPKFSL